MDAIDTNVLVRYLIGDHPEQSRKAYAAIKSRTIFVSITVLLESEWVLRSLYGQSTPEICEGFRALAGLPALLNMPKREWILRTHCIWAH